jgi:hypothetical protein
MTVSDENRQFAVRVLHARSRKTGEEKTIRATIGHPAWKVEGRIAVCPVALDGLYGQLNDIAGVDHLDALRNSVEMIEKLLDGAREHYDLFWPDGEPFMLTFNGEPKGKGDGSN